MKSTEKVHTGRTPSLQRRGRPEQEAPPRPPLKAQSSSRVILEQMSGAVESGLNRIGAMLRGNSKFRSPRQQNYEDKAADLAKKGLAADVVLAYSSSSAARVSTIRAKTRASRYSINEGRLEEEREMLISIITSQPAGLRVVIGLSRDRLTTLLKVTAPLQRLEMEAERVGMDMLLLDESKTDGHRSDLPAYADFARSGRQHFALKHGRLFSALERQRLIFSILEATRDRGGAQLNLDDLVRRGVLTAYLPLHDPAEHEHLHGAWSSIRMWPCRDPRTGEKKRLFPDFGLCQQPLHAIRDYYGEKVAFYFAWLDQYTSWLWLLTFAAVALEVLRTCDSYDFISLDFFEGDGVRCPGDYASFDEQQACQARQAWTLPITCVMIALWATFRGAFWQRKQNVLAYQWDVLDFEQEEAPRAEFVQAYYKGFWAAEHKQGRVERHRSMQKRNGFYTAGTGRVRRFVPHPKGDEHLVMPPRQRLWAYALMVPTLMLVAAFTITVMLMILSFRTLMKLDSYFDDTIFNWYWASWWGAGLNTVWVSMMNVVYRRLAERLNSFENHRTQTEHEDALIIKTFVFQCINSYGPIVYIALLKPLGPILFDSWGKRDPYGCAYNDICGSRGHDWWAAVGCDVDMSTGCIAESCDNGKGRFIYVRTDCWDLMRIQMICFVALKPMYEVPLQIIVPRLLRRFRNWRRDRAFRKRFDEQMTPSAAHTLDSVRRRVESMRVRVGDSLGWWGSATTTSSTNTNSSIDPDPTDSTAKFAALHHFDSEIEDQLSMQPYGGTFNEYNSKVVQFGYIALFSACFPIGSFVATLANFFELRVDARKLGYEVRRPRYMGARDVGSWQGTMETMAWVSILINVVLLATSWTLRDHFVIPLMVASRSEDACDTTTLPELITPFGAWSGTNISWSDERCGRNYELCFAEVGAVPWLPASVYLDEKAYRSESYLDLLCDSTSAISDGAHHDENKCAICSERRNTVWLYTTLLLVILEHAIIAAKLFVTWSIPDKPTWLAQSEARDDFLAQQARGELKAQDPSAKQRKSGSGSLLSRRCSTSALRSRSSNSASSLQSASSILGRESGTPSIAEDDEHDDDDDDDDDEDGGSDEEQALSSRFGSSLSPSARCVEFEELSPPPPRGASTQPSPVRRDIVEPQGEGRTSVTFPTLSNAAVQQI